ncbi:hypothetical protein ABK040_003597 [Willaertia magna]
MGTRRKENYRNKSATNNAAPKLASNNTPLGVSIGARTSTSKPPKQYIPTSEVYNKILSHMRTKENMMQLAISLNKYLFNAKDWKYYYFDHSWKEFSNVRCALRKLVQMTTLQTLLRGKYFIEVSEEQEHEKALKLKANALPNNDEEVLELEEDDKELNVKKESNKKNTKKDAKKSKKDEIDDEDNNEEEEVAPKAINNKKDKKKEQKRKKKLSKKKDEFIFSDKDYQLNEEEEENVIPEDDKEEDSEETKKNTKNKKKQQKIKKQQEKNKKKESELTEEKKSGSEEEEQDDENQLLNLDNFKEEKGIPVKPVFFDFNALKKGSKNTQKIDHSENDNVNRIVSVSSTKKKHSHKEEEEINKPQFIVLEGDALEVAIHLKRVKKVNPLLLVYASQSVPAGDYQKGGDGQEEEICRRSALALCLEDPFVFDDTRMWAYPIPEIGGIYVPQCLVLRKPKEQGYEFYERPSTVSMYALSYYTHPPVEKRKVVTVSNTNNTKEEGNNNALSEESNNYEYFLASNKLSTLMKKKIASYLEIALTKGHDALVIDSLGYENPSYHIATLFKEVLNSDLYRDKFKYVVFAMYNKESTIGHVENEEEEHTVNVEEKEVSDNEEEEDDDDFEDSEEEDEEMKQSPRQNVTTTRPQHVVLKQNDLISYAKVFLGKEDNIPTMEEFFTE